MVGPGNSDFSLAENGAGAGGKTGRSWPRVAASGKLSPGVGEGQGEAGVGRRAAESVSDRVVDGSRRGIEWGQERAKPHLWGRTRAFFCSYQTAAVFISFLLPKIIDSHQGSQNVTT